MISRLALRRVVILASKHQPFTKHQTVTSRLIQTNARVSQCETPTNADAVDEGSFNYDRMLLDTAIDDLDALNVEELPTTNADAVESTFDIEEILLQSVQSVTPPDAFEVPPQQDEVDEGSFNYDRMLLDTAIDDLDALNVEELPEQKERVAEEESGEKVLALLRGRT